MPGLDPSSRRREGMVRCCSHDTPFGFHLHERARLAAGYLHHRRWYDPTLMQRPESVSNSDGSGLLHSTDDVDDLLARDAEAEELDVADDNHIVIRFFEDRAVQDLVDILCVAARHEPHRLGRTLRCLYQPLALRVLA